VVCSATAVTAMEGNMIRNIDMEETTEVDFTYYQIIDSVAGCVCTKSAPKRTYSGACASI
jgi:hypothetical protein